MGQQIPQTLEELQAFANAHEIPLEKLHVHLGEDYHGPKAFGIYKDGDEFVVYKNKADGMRAVRYRGTDEAFAVKEIYQKMREMGNAAKASNATRSSSDVERIKQYESASKHAYKRRSTGKKLFYVGIVVVCMILFGTLLSKHEPKYRRGYYNYRDQYYYSDGYDWYCYEGGLWCAISSGILEEITEDYETYSVNYVDEGLEPCTVQASYDDDDDDWDNDWDDDDWYDDNDWDYDYDDGWDWDSDW